MSIRCFIWIYANKRLIYAKCGLLMIDFFRTEQTFTQIYLGKSRFLTHAVFWLSYYFLFSFIWMKPESGLYASFLLEFILMPVRILAAYCMLYFLIPHFLVLRKYQQFFLGYGILILIAGILQLLFSHFFYYRLLLNQTEINITISALVRNIILINTTVLFLGTAKIFLLYMRLLESVSDKEKQDAVMDIIEVKSDRRVHRLPLSQILFIEGMGNYITYYLDNGEKKVVYSSIKETERLLSQDFIRLHRSYIVNREKLSRIIKTTLLSQAMNCREVKKLLMRSFNDDVFC